MSAKAPKIQRSHSGCRQCRRRGKRCDETKPRCRACARLLLECSYGVDFRFRNLTGALFHQHTTAKIAPSRSAPSSQPSTLKSPGHVSNSLIQHGNATLPNSLNPSGNIDSRYFSHFHHHVRHLLPAASIQFMEGLLQSPGFRFSVLCISASNLSMLDARVQSRTVADNNSQIPVFGPLVNSRHHRHAHKYHNQAIWYSRRAQVDGVVGSQAPALLATHVLLAYYHHASTDHLKFRLAVWDSVHFVMRHREAIMASPDGPGALQMWYRLCTSHRPAKPPALLLEGEGASSFGPNLLPDPTDHLYLNCVLGMGADDLIYDILIRTMELRAKLVLYRCVAGTRHISELSREISSLTYEVWNEMLGRQCVTDEYAESREGFVRGSHLLGLLDVQKERLQVWKSRLTPDQLPRECVCDKNASGQQRALCSMCPRFPTHRDAMNALYCMLCELMFEEAHAAVTCHSGPTIPTTATERLADSMCQVASMLDLTISNMSDVYTFSLAETLLQLVFLFRSDAIFHFVLDILWPRLESKGRGYEHSHYPTHLVKRIITQIAAYWSQGRIVSFALPAVAEDIPKLKLLDIEHPIDLVVCGCNKDGKHFIERLALP